MPYIPALVFTLYDGYYIYSPHEYNYEVTQITKEGENKVEKTGFEHILKPYVHYIARYKNGNTDVTVNYSLDNYISIYGTIDGEYVAKSGYLIDLNKIQLSGNKVIGYKASSTYIMQTNVDETITQFDENNNFITKKSDSMKKYYQEAYEFTNWIKGKSSLINAVTPENAIKSDGTKYVEFKGNSKNILNISSSNDPEEKVSDFVQHKQEIMKISIQENLNNAIAVYNDNSPSMGTHANFKMPILTEDDWEKILTNVNMISFMEGIPVGTKIYNNYAIVTSTQNKQYINPNSLYFIDNTNTYHRINCPELTKNVKNGNSIIGYKAIDFRKMQNTQDKTKYYYKHKEQACYNCIVNSLNEDINMSELTNEQLRAYYSALARERYDLDKITKMLK